MFWVQIPLKPSWSSRPNPEDQINRKPDDRKNDQTTEKAKNLKTKSNAIKPNIRSNLHLVNFNVLFEKVKNSIVGKLL